MQSNIEMIDSDGNRTQDIKLWSTRGRSMDHHRVKILNYNDNNTDDSKVMKNTVTLADSKRLLNPKSSRTGDP